MGGAGRARLLTTKLRVAMLSSRQASQTTAAVTVALVVLAVAYWSRRGWLAQEEHCDEHRRSQAQDRIPCDVLTSQVWRSRLSTLTEISLARCGLKSLSPNIRYCVNLVKLDLAHNDLQTLPKELELLPKLEILFVLGSRRMTQMPSVLGRLKSVTRLGLRSNGIERVVADGIPPLVEHLILTDNRIREIDDDAYARFGRLRKLMLANNALETFTGGRNVRDNLRSLELVRLANNDLRELPTAVLLLPKLAWIAVAGNSRLVGPSPSVGAIPRLTWDELEFDNSEGLGSGASGVVRSASWRGARVAVKRLLDKSSDGRASDEVASVEALFGPGALAPPPSLVRTLGVIEPVDDKPTALVMELLPRGCRDLAKPPTIVEVTRDRYPDAERFSPHFVYNIATNVCAALVHIHAKHVCHGDVYAHNTLIDNTSGTVKLGDLGASFTYLNYYAPDDIHLFELVEVRAFGVLIAELATRIVHETAEGIKESLLRMADTCLQSDVERRPRFTAIQAHLASLRPTDLETNYQALRTSA